MRALLSCLLAAACLSVLAVAEAAPGIVRPAEAGSVVAVLDTGVTASVPELAGRTLPGIDLVDGAAGPADPNGHGTAVASAVAGACPACRILPVRVLSSKGAAPWSRVAEGIVRAVASGARVINVSIAGAGGSSELREAVAYAVARDVLVVAAAGNTAAAEPQYPAAYPGVVAVGAARSEWSARGGWVDLLAPGCASLPTSPRERGWACGTSFAAPAAAGVAGRERGLDRDAPAGAIARRLPALVTLDSAPATVRVSGSARPGATLHATATGVAGGERLRWFRCAAAAGPHECAAVSTGARYRVRPADVGATLVARVVTGSFGGLWLASSARLPVA